MQSSRLDKARAHMREMEVDALVLGPGADFRYLTGLDAHLSERLTTLLLPQQGSPRIFAPVLEASSLQCSGVTLTCWEEHENPLDLVAGALQQMKALQIGVGDHLWSRFLLALQDRQPGVRWFAASEVLAPVRLIKDSDEIALLRQAASAADRVWERVTGLKLEGMTERSVATHIEALLEAYGHDHTAFLIVGSGPNGASPHHSLSDRRLQDGDMVVMDYGGTVQGYHSDITRTLCIGQANDEQRRVYEAVREAQERAVQAVRPGATTGEVDAAARSYLESQGLAEYFIHRVGHGLGLEVHEPPYLVTGSKQELREGMVFSIEPGVYLPGRFGVRIEDIVVVTASGCERLNNAPRELLEC